MFYYFIVYILFYVLCILFYYIYCFAFRYICISSSTTVPCGCFVILVIRSFSKTAEISQTSLDFSNYKASNESCNYFIMLFWYLSLFVSASSVLLLSYYTDVPANCLTDLDFPLKSMSRASHNYFQFCHCCAIKVVQKL